MPFTLQGNVDYIDDNLHVWDLGVEINLLMLRSRQVSHNYHHKHGAYILDNADAPVFAVLEMHHLSLLVLGY